MTTTEMTKQSPPSPANSRFSLLLLLLFSLFFLYQSCKIPQGVHLCKSKKTKLCRVQQKIQASMFQRSRRKQEEDAAIEQEIRQKNSYWCVFFVFFFLKPITTISFFPLSLKGHHTVRWGWIICGRRVFSSDCGVVKHPQHTRPLRFEWLVNPVQHSPSSPTHSATSPHKGGGLVVKFLFSFKNTDDKTHQYSTGGWEGWIWFFVWLTQVSFKKQSK